MNKVISTNNKNYGYDFPSQSPEVKEYVEQYFLEKYNRKNYSQIHISKESLEILTDCSLLEKMIIEIGIPNTCSNLGISISTLYKSLRRIGSNICNGMRSISEIEIENWLRSINININPNDRIQIKPYELDFYLIDYNKAIEYQGDYWHMNPELFESDDFNACKDKTAQEIWDYDLMKFEKCKEKNIDVFYIWEADWNQYKEKIKLKVLDFINSK